MSRLVKAVQEANAPFTMEIVKSIARLCNEDPYELWHAIASGPLQHRVTVATPVAKEVQVRDSTGAARPNVKALAQCWRCTACNRTFNDVKHLVNHITFFVRQKDKAHLQLYRTVKESADKSGKTFTQVVEEMLRC